MNVTKSNRQFDFAVTRPAESHQVGESICSGPITAEISVWGSVVCMKEAIRFNITTAQACEFVALSTFKGLTLPIRTFIFSMTATPKVSTAASLCLTKAFAGTEMRFAVLKPKRCYFNSFIASLTLQLDGSCFEFTPTLLRAKYLIWMAAVWLKFLFANWASFWRVKVIHPGLVADTGAKMVNFALDSIRRALKYLSAIAASQLHEFTPCIIGTGFPAVNGGKSVRLESFITLRTSL